MNAALVFLLGMSTLTNNIHTAWSDIDYDDETIINVSEKVQFLGNDKFKYNDLLLTHNKSIGVDSIPEININDDKVRKEYTGPCIVLGWATNNSIYVYHIESNKFVIV